MRPPGDKSISHRAFMFGLLTRGETKVDGLLEGEDVLRTGEACQALGAVIERLAPGAWRIHGPGLGALLRRAKRSISATPAPAARLMMGVVGGHGITATFDGDASLRKRPMRRILDPLRLMGAQVLSEAEGGRCPIVLKGAREPAPIVYRTPVASAQIKSAVLLAGLNAPGVTTVIESEASRDHTEKMLAHFGAEVAVAPEGEGRRITLVGRPELRPATVVVPADPSSAAFPIVAALIVPGSDIVVEGVMMNPLRTGLLDDADRDGRPYRDARQARRRRRGGRGLEGARGHAQRRRRSRRPRALDDRRISDPGGRRRFRLRLDADARFARIAGSRRAIGSPRSPRGSRPPASIAPSRATISSSRAGGRAAAAWSRPNSITASR